jgi:hypothetical protein
MKSDPHLPRCPHGFSRAALLLGVCLLGLAPFTGLVLAKGDPSGARALSQPIPDRPETLSYPPLEYAPPVPGKYRVTLRNGPVAYVVPDRELPLVNLVIYVRAGQYLDPAGKEGLAGLMGYLLARGGTQAHTAEALEERLAFLAADLNSGVGDTQGSVSLNLLSKDLPEGLAILRRVMSTPRFQEDKLALRKQQILQAMQQRNDESSSIEAREAGFLAYGEQFWGNHHSTAASIPSSMVSSVQFCGGGERRFRSQPDDCQARGIVCGLAVRRRQASRDSDQHGFRQSRGVFGR